MTQFASYRPRTSNTPVQSLPGTLTIRPATHYDLAPLALLRTACLKRVYTNHLRTLQEELAMIAQGTARLLIVAEHQGIIIGTARAAYYQPHLFTNRNSIPEGWYLLGVLVYPQYRRYGVAMALTRYRLNWLTTRTSQVWFFANANNRASIDLHWQLGFHEVERNIEVPGVTFSNGIGVLWTRRLP